MADETKIIRIEVEGGPNVDKAVASVDKMSNKLVDNKKAMKDNTQSFKDASPALDNLTGGAVSFAEGTAGMTKSALAFIATPIGAVIGAIGIAIGALVAYFHSSEDAQNKWNKIMLVGSTIVEKLMDFVEDLGGALVSAFENPGKTLEAFWKLLKENVVNRFDGLLELIPKLGQAIGLLFEGKFSESAKVATDAVGKVTLGINSVTDVVSAAADAVVSFAKDVATAVDVGIKSGIKLANMQAQLDKEERSLIVGRAQTALEVSKLREEAITQEGDAKRATINEAIELEQALADKETAHAQLKLQQAILERNSNGDTKEAKLKVAEAEAGVANAEATRFQATLRFQKEIEKLHDEEAKQIQKNLDDRQKAEKKFYADQAKNVQDSEDQMMAIIEDSNKRQKESDEKVGKVKADLADKEVAGLELVTGKKTIARTIGTALFKKDALAQTYISTKEGAINAYAALAGIPIVGPVLGAVAAAAVIAFGAAQAAGILGIGFESGGFTGEGGNSDVAGVVHRNEYVVPARIVANPAYAGYISALEGARLGYQDGGLVMDQNTIDTDVQLTVARAMGNMQIVASWKEATELDARIKIKEALTKAS